MSYFHALLLAVLLTAPVALAETQVRYLNKSISISPFVCLEERDSNNQLFRLRIEGGYQKELGQELGHERLEIILNQVDQLLVQGKGEIVLTNPAKEGNVCLRSFEESRETPRTRTFCLSKMKGDDSCRLKYEYATGLLTVSFQCRDLRWVGPSVSETLSFSVPEEHPIQCQLSQPTVI